MASSLRPIQSNPCVLTSYFTLLTYMDEDLHAAPCTTSRTVFKVTIRQREYRKFFVRRRMERDWQGCGQALFVALMGGFANATVGS